MTTIQQLPDNTFDVQDENGQSLLGPFGGPYHTRGLAETTQRMINAFEAVETRIETINHSLKGGK